MNYLAHIYLSGDDDLVTIGNFIADGVKGKAYKNFPIEIQKGILLHRAIDTYTDANNIVRSSTKRLHKNYGHFAGVIVDIYYDHFLAKNWRDYSTQSLDDYAQDFYSTLQNNLDILPEKILRMIPFMIADNWLVSYANLEGIQRVFNGMNRRITYIDNLNEATQDLKQHYSEFENEFSLFFKELQIFSEETLTSINAQYQH